MKPYLSGHAGRLNFRENLSLKEIREMDNGNDGREEMNTSFPVGMLKVNPGTLAMEYRERNIESTFLTVWVILRS